VTDDAVATERTSNDLEMTLSSILTLSLVVMWCCSFEHLLNTNTGRLLMCRLVSRWTNMRLCIVTSSVVSFIALIIFLLRDVMPTSYAGAALIYAFQVCHRFAWTLRFSGGIGASQMNNLGQTGVPESLLDLLFKLMLKSEH